MESDDVFREEGAKGDAAVVRVGSNDSFLHFLSCRQNPQTDCLDSRICATGRCVVTVVESFADHVDSWTNLWP